MYSRRLQGTNLEWTRYEIVMDVGEKATNLGNAIDHTVFVFFFSYIEENSRITNEI